LITSRDASLIPKYGGAIIGPLEQHHATNLLFRYLSDNDRDGRNDDDLAAAKQIVQRLGYLPIAILQATQFIRKDGLTLRQFLAAYNERRLISASINTATSSDQVNLSTIWNMSYKALTADQRDLLNLLSFFDPDRIPQNMITEGAAKAVREGKTMLQFIADDKRFRRGRSGLVKSSLVTQNEFTNELWLHRLVQNSTHIRMDRKSYQEAFDRALAILMARWPMTDPDNRHQVELWPSQNILLPHALSLARFYDESQSSEFALYADPEILILLFNASL
jgi:hypothetical protein